VTADYEAETGVESELDCVIEIRGCPRMIVSDHGTEFTSNLAWQEEQGIEWHYIAPVNRRRMALSKASMADCGKST
jgi:hypothetical protein